MPTVRLMVSGGTSLYCKAAKQTHNGTTPTVAWSPMLQQTQPKQLKRPAATLHARVCRRTSSQMLSYQILRGASLGEASRSQHALASMLVPAVSVLSAAQDSTPCCKAEAAPATCPHHQHTKETGPQGPRRRSQCFVDLFCCDGLVLARKVVVICQEQHAVALLRSGCFSDATDACWEHAKLWIGHM